MYFLNKYIWHLQRKINVIMKKVFMLLGVAAIIFGMSSCKKACDCTVSYTAGGYTTSRIVDWGEQSASNCEAFQTAYKAQADNDYIIKCSED